MLVRKTFASQPGGPQGAGGYIYIYIYIYIQFAARRAATVPAGSLKPTSQRLSFLSGGAGLKSEFRGPWARFWHPRGVTLASFWHPRGPLWLHLGTLGDHFGALWSTLGTFGRQGRIWSSFRRKKSAIWGPFWTPKSQKSRTKTKKNRVRKTA